MLQKTIMHMHSHSWQCHKTIVLQMGSKHSPLLSSLPPPRGQGGKAVGSVTAWCCDQRRVARGHMKGRELFSSAAIIEALAVKHNLWCLWQVPRIQSSNCPRQPALSPPDKGKPQAVSDQPAAAALRSEQQLWKKVRPPSHPQEWQGALHVPCHCCRWDFCR